MMLMIMMCQMALKSIMYCKNEKSCKKESLVQKSCWNVPFIGSKMRMYDNRQLLINTMQARRNVFRGGGAQMDLGGTNDRGGGGGGGGGGKGEIRKKKN